MTSATVNGKPAGSSMYGGVDNYSYEMQFTADISKQMQMPDRLAAVDSVRKMVGLVEPTPRLFGIDSPAFDMTMPDKIILGEDDYDSDHHTLTVVEDTEFDFAAGYESDEPRQFSRDPYINVTPPKQRHDADLFAAGDMVVPATPGSMLRSSVYGTTAANGGISGPASDVFGTDWTTIQRHVAKLTCRVERLEEENGRRRQREMLLYPLILGYCIWQVARLLLTRTK